MAVRKVQIGGLRKSNAETEALKSKLLAEWDNTNATAPGAPEIREETDRAGNVVHVYVIWDEWRNLDQLQRSELITDAFISKYGEQAINHFTVAMGLTADEARRMGIE